MNKFETINSFFNFQLTLMNLNYNIKNNLKFSKFYMTNGIFIQLIN